MFSMSTYSKLLSIDQGWCWFCFGFVSVFFSPGGTSWSCCSWTDPLVTGSERWGCVVIRRRDVETLLNFWCIGFQLVFLESSPLVVCFIFVIVVNEHCTDGSYGLRIRVPELVDSFYWHMCTKLYNSNNTIQLFFNNYCIELFHCVSW